MRTHPSRLAPLSLPVLCSLIYSTPAHASTSVSGLPWEGWLTMVTNSITGPVGGALAVLFLVAAGVRYAKAGHGEGVDWTFRGLAAATLILGGANILSLLGLTAATI